MAKELAVKIRLARLEAGLTQDAFAVALRVASRTPQRWESGDVEPTARHLARICEVTRKPPEFFIGDEENAPDLFERLASDLREIARTEVARELRRLREAT